MWPFGTDVTFYIIEFFSVVVGSTLVTYYFKIIFYLKNYIFVVLYLLLVLKSILLYKQDVNLIVYYSNTRFCFRYENVKSEP